MAINQISTATNLQGPDLSNPTKDANKTFTNLFTNNFNISGNTNDVIVAFFEEYAVNEIAAKNLAAALIYTAKAQNLDPLQVLADFQKLPKGQLNNYLAAFLNANRVPTSQLGFSSKTSGPSIYITRSILP